MTTFWSWYVVALTSVTIVGLVWLVLSTSSGQRKETTQETMGHVWDGIEEYDNPLPRWWFWLYMGTVIFSIGYLILYPGMGNWKGILPGYEGGWTSAKQWEREVARADEKYGPIFAAFKQQSVEELANDQRAMEIGSRLFANHCAICHGSDAKGSPGFPNLADSDWRWGGTPEQIKASITAGRTGMMTAHAYLGEEAVKNVAAYVRQELAGLKNPEGTTADLAAGKETFGTTCFACHGADGKGMAVLGSPDLTSPAGWIWGTSLSQVEKTIRDGRTGVMPAQKEFLTEEKIHVLAGYVYSLSN